MKKVFLLASVLLLTLVSSAQNCYWQQKVNYKMDIDFNDEKHQFKGIQELTYFNNSPDTLKKVFYHLYFNAFQPGSMMDVRSRTIQDPDRRVTDRIFNLNQDEIGYHKINSLTMNGEAVSFTVEGTILEVTLSNPILPGKKAKFKMDFDSQVPIQIRRSGRDNVEGIEYSMTQWYPKMCEYDKEGWHANPYIGREFHGVWGDFDVTIHLNKEYTIGGTGILQNPNEIGKGYESEGASLKLPEGDNLHWNFVAENVHDFAWAADKQYRHTTEKMDNGMVFHFFSTPDTLLENWDSLPKYAIKCFEYMNENFGEYPYKQYSFIQGGDGGMEYPMATLIAGKISLRALVSVAVHEAIHSWYQHALATNEAKYSWMDEGFTSYAQDVVLNEIWAKKKKENPHLSAYMSYYRLVDAGIEEPLTTHADHYHTNRAYGVNAYSKGQVFLHQLGYIVGEDILLQSLKRYYNEWKFKHPTDMDFKRVVERVSGIELDWYFEHWVGTINKIDYGIKNVAPNGNKTNVVLQRVGDMPMPIELYVKTKAGEIYNFYIPLRIMRGEKKPENSGVKNILKPDWPWVYPEYNVTLNIPFDQIEIMDIDPTLRMADVDASNNTYPSNEDARFFDE